MPPVAVPNEAPKKQLRVAIIGQSTFAAEVFKLLQKDGHEVVGVFTVLDKGNREDPLATIATQYGKPVFKYKTWRVKGKVIPEVLEQYKSKGRQISRTSILAWPNEPPQSTFRHFERRNVTGGEPRRHLLLPGIHTYVLVTSRCFSSPYERRINVHM
ncbi:Aldehyde dehydrogenase family 1 member L2, mitochondrial [Papilio machaon]|uniref:Aldehyde dehydrogenase family 1 member L2, mitochondrial n=1 Tax=Papilio machaon TaxID=76193 RepID=A0A194RF76_PAPMA|nr:Aldehyde dehydrogenase family 1 member L2, mitochondrial [Papilio machaon]